MATIGGDGLPTLASVMKMLAPGDQGLLSVTNVLSKHNPILQDIPWYEGNLPTGHRISNVNALPSGTWRKYNGAVAVTDSSEETFDESCGMLEDYSRVDPDLAMLGGNAAAYRSAKDLVKVEALSQQFATALFYSSIHANPEQVHGLSPRYAATTGYKASNYVLKGTTSGVDAQSIWLINWAPGKLYGIFPKGTTAGLKKTDKGELVQANSAGAMVRALTTHFQWKCGIAVEDYRYAVRFQWDPGDSDFAAGAKGLILAMQKMIDTIYDGPDMRFYMNRTSRALLTQQMVANDARFMTFNEENGKQVTRFGGVPVRTTDALVAESAIS